MEKDGIILIYDGSFEGFLTCVFTVFEQKLKVTAITISGYIQQEIFSCTEEIVTDLNKAERVKKDCFKNIQKDLNQLFYAFLSEQPGIELTLLHYIQLAFKNHYFSSKDFGNATILKISQVSKMVSREKHRMEAFVRFKLTKDNIYFAHIEPDFNVLPVILKHFEGRYKDQKWIIYDLRRKTEFYNLHVANYISLDLCNEVFLKDSNSTVYSTSEAEFQKLWQQYFKSTNIKSRKNMKLHLQHIPKDIGNI